MYTYVIPDKVARTDAHTHTHTHSHTHTYVYSSRNGFFVCFRQNGYPLMPWSYINLTSTIQKGVLQTVYHSIDVLEFLLYATY